MQTQGNVFPGSYGIQATPRLHPFTIFTLQTVNGSELFNQPRLSKFGYLTVNGSIVILHSSDPTVNGSSSVVLSYIRQLMKAFQDTVEMPKRENLNNRSHQNTAEYQNGERLSH